MLRIGDFINVNATSGHGLYVVSNNSNGHVVLQKLARTF
jgi:hypothetical protein